MTSEKNDLTFSDLRKHYGTGRAYTISGTGRDRVMGYRTGVKCNAGDIEVSEWIQMMKDLIKRSGEQELYMQLHAFMKERNYVRASRSELEKEVLELHASRIFDNELWIYFVQFNQLFRPDILNSVRLRWVRSECCKKAGLVTEEMLKRRGDGPIPCPICGRFAHCELMNYEYERKLVG